MTAGDIARLVGGTVHGDEHRRIRAVGTLETADEHTISWVGHARYAGRIAASRAGVLLLPLDIPPPEGRTCVRVKDADLALCTVLAHFAPPADTVPPGVHPTAVVAPSAVVAGAAIGPHVTVGAGAVVSPGTQLHAGVRVGRGVLIGRDCTLWPNVVVREHCVLGERVVLHPQVCIGADGFGYLQRGGRHVKVPQIGIAIVEDDVEVGAGTCIDRAKTGATRIGAGTKIDNLTQIGHNCQIGPGCVIVAQCALAGSVTLGRFVMLAGHVGVSDHVSVGDGCMVMAKSCVTRDAPANSVLRGDPAEPHTAYARQLLLVRRLPDLRDQLRELTRRIDELESSANH